MRKLATIREAKELRPIPGADNIECAIVDGWTVVVKKGEFSPGDKGVFFEIDSWIPENLITSPNAPLSFLEPKMKEWEGNKGFRIRTIKLKGQLSQGLIIPVKHICPYNNFTAGEDLTERLGIKLWEPTIPANLMGKILGKFPSFIQRTDQERIQNMLYEVFTGNIFSLYEITTKLDGTSITVYKYHDKCGVCSRNLEKKLEDNDGDAYVKTATESGLLSAVKNFPANIAVQGELMGPGIQKNREGLLENMIFVFDIYDCDGRKYLSPEERCVILELLKQDGARVAHVPIVEKCTQLPFNDLEGALKYADGPSLNAKRREGVVFKRWDDGMFSFKIINNEYLLRED